MSDHIHKRHNKNVLLYHIVCPIKYRRKVLTDEVEKGLKEIQKMPSYSGLPDQEFIEFMKVHFQWEFLHKGTEGVVFKKQTGDVTVAIKVINSEQLNPHSARSSTAVKAQLLRLFKQECNVEGGDVYACSPNVMVMEYIDAPLLEDYFPEERKKEMGQGNMGTCKLCFRSPDLCKPGIVWP